jgi:hypothetical protein
VEIMPYRRLAPVIAAALLGAALGACGGSTSGPCEVRFDGGVVRVVAASDALTGASLGQLSLSGFAIQGVAVSDLGELVEPIPSLGATISGDGLLCTVACEFGTTEGTYRFTAAAAGYQPKEVTVDARYASHRGNCPARLGDGTTVSIALAPASP